jgi:hypothetical protein
MNARDMAAELRAQARALHDLADKLESGPVVEAEPAQAKSVVTDMDKARARALLRKAGVSLGRADR